MMFGGVWFDVSSEKRDASVVSAALRVRVVTVMFCCSYLIKMPVCVPIDSLFLNCDMIDAVLIA